MGPAPAIREPPGAARAAYDEAFDLSGRARPGYEPVLAMVDAAGPGELTRRVAEWLDARQVRFGSAAGETPFHVDPVPRLISGDEWRLLEAGLSQRARALNAFIADAYSERRIVTAGRVPPGALTAADHYEAGLEWGELPAMPAPVIGFDLVRDERGELLVLEDNLRTPSGITYALAARGALDDALGDAGQAGRQDAAGALDMLDRAIAVELARAPGEIAVLLSDGPSNSAWYEHRTLARALAMPLLGPGDLRQCGSELRATVDGAEHSVGLILRRTDEDRLRDERGAPTWLGELFAAAARAGVAVVNAPGAGVADDKLLCAYVDEMIRFYLNEEPRLRSVRTLDPGDPSVRDEVLERLGELVLKPRSALGGAGVTIGPATGSAELARLAGELRVRPGDFVAQELVTLSTHPTVCEGTLEPRHVDLRAFALGGELAPAPLTRVALTRGDLVVNSSRAGGAKDTWVVEG